MKIAVFHNVPGGGAKRAILEITRRLAARGHTLVELCPSTAEVERYSLSPFIQARQIMPLPWPLWERRIPFVTPYLQAGANLAGAARYHRRSREMARRLEGESFDLLFANDCSILLNPPIAGYARIPTLLNIQHGSHLSCEAGNER